MATETAWGANSMVPKKDAMKFDRALRGIGHPPHGVWHPSMGGDIPLWAVGSWQFVGFNGWSAAEMRPAARDNR